MGRGIIRPHLGLLSLAAVLREHGHRVRLVDALALDLTPEAAARAVLRDSPQVVAFTAFSLSIAQAAEVARRVKSADPAILTVVGGPHLSALPVETLATFAEFDVGAIGEGEDTLPALLDRFGETDFSAVVGLVFRHGDQIRVTAPRAPIRDLDALPFPAWDLLEGFPRRYPLPRIRYRRFPVADVCTSRGCPYRCTFCDRSVFGSRYRAFSPRYVLEHIEWLRRHLAIREVMFKDDLIMADRKRMVALCEGMLGANWGLSWSCMGRADRVDRSLLELMREAGCWQISYGIETGNQAILDRVKKDLALERVEAALRLTKEAGISPRGFFILGLPGETRQTMRDTIRFATRSVLEDINVALCTPFPGTELSRTAPSCGSFVGTWANMNKFHAGFVPFGLTPGSLERSLTRFYFEFFARPHRMWTLGRRLLDRN
jgi:radical SAM superfamily enzyme YgiQ (UPF0313 family)